MGTYTIQVRDRRQATIPNKLLKQLGASIGDLLEVRVQKNRVTIKSKRQVALSALREIQTAFARSRVPETTLQRSLR